jgi:RNA polymerase sigma-70 factor (ECF subfamily)
LAENFADSRDTGMVVRKWLIFEYLANNPASYLPRAWRAMSDVDTSNAEFQTAHDYAEGTHPTVQERVAGLYEAYREPIYRFLVGQGIPPATAQEQVQDDFVRLFVALTKGTVIESEKAWLYSVAARIAVDYWRREGCPMWVELDDCPAMVESLKSNNLTPEATVIEEQRLQRVAAELARLPEAQRFAIHLRMQGLRYRAIAQVLGVSLSTTSELLSTAVKRLQIAANE